MGHLYLLRNITGGMINLKLLRLTVFLMAQLSIIFWTRIAGVVTTGVHPSQRFHLNMQEEISIAAFMYHIKHTKTMTQCFSMAKLLPPALYILGVGLSDFHQVMECYSSKMCIFPEYWQLYVDGSNILEYIIAVTNDSFYR